MAQQIGEETKVTLDLKTLGIISAGIFTLAAMWFALQSDIALAKELPAPVIDRIEYDLKDELIRQTILDTQEDISSQFYFVRAKNKDFNYSTNASYIDANGNLNFTSMIDNPVSYITTVGLYNDANELLAVAKMSQPITKDFTKEALIKVKLDY